MINCPNCNTELPPEARFCWNCGAPQVSASFVEQEEATITFDDTLEKEIVDRFFKLLQIGVEQEQDASMDKLYAERVYASGFREILHRRVTQLVESFHADYPAGKMPTQRFEQEVEAVLMPILDYFFIQYCQDLNQIQLPEAILKYSEVSFSEIDFFQMVLDYLALEQEKEPFYTDFLKMPIEKLKNAGKMFLFPEKNERILLICDLSLLGSCKEGFALTEAALYWKAYLQKPKIVAFQQLQSIKREKDWLLINGEFFSANASINVKLLKLLKKIKALSQ
ncbi:MAG: zinc ribbon domain-containing protein [Bacteroidota bacterium]